MVMKILAKVQVIAVLGVGVLNPVHQSNMLIMLFTLNPRVFTELSTHRLNYAAADS